MCLCVDVNKTTPARVITTFIYWGINMFKILSWLHLGYLAPQLMEWLTSVAAVQNLTESGDFLIHSQRNSSHCWGHLWNVFFIWFSGICEITESRFELCCRQDRFLLWRLLYFRGHRMNRSSASVEKDTLLKECPRPPLNMVYVITSHCALNAFTSVLWIVNLWSDHPRRLSASDVNNVFFTRPLDVQFPTCSQSLEGV